MLGASSTPGHLCRKSKPSVRFSATSRVQFNHCVGTREYLKRKDEIFKRIRPLTLYNLLIEHEEAPESIYDTIHEAPRVAVVEADADTAGKKVGSLIGV